MTATAHALIGASIAAAIPDPAIGIPLVAISHPIADMIPHWDFGRGWKSKKKLVLFFQSIADLTFGVILSYILFGQSVSLTYLFLAILISESWDILQAPYWLLNWKFPPFSYFYNFGHQTNSTAKLPWGILTQAATVTGLVLVLRVIH
ncbi:hypothetical protein A3C26_02115 [Candidatus Daviesbacteria bacterium RIFCSPHIGHO2_02_FULL_39_12]|uniref:Uncharacterized protein n=1 Tax=Candidatus Daviesbacteria bacterium RIFCSPHIGHO2_02_FULL_39_12 TaxID=1797770 RepID=A0A1F5J9B1_9BACT|nr:MAG: hypothetical protein A3C26_02115 [Candidatus Daviesbacteria bacterium RIFCSPHIGHO2_02_FULL_39_12]